MSVQALPAEVHVWKSHQASVSILEWHLFTFQYNIAMPSFMEKRFRQSSLLM